MENSHQRQHVTWGYGLLIFEEVGGASFWESSGTCLLIVDFSCYVSHLKHPSLDSLHLMISKVVIKLRHLGEKIILVALSCHVEA